MLRAVTVLGDTSAARAAAAGHLRPAADDGQDSDGEKYDTDVDLSNDNTSHTLLAQLVGRGARVLDVGCATGYLAAALRTMDCSVSGIEYDPAAADKARPHLDQLVVGSVDEIDLTGEFGAGAFDAIVFGDVLEHLPDPAATLRRVLPLLAEGGAVVVSVPNIAHGAVRLSLLDGRFDYTRTGLLDETHIRFFTLSGVEDLARRSALRPVALRRTVAGLAETELAIDPWSYPAAVVQRVLDDPESTTYQFVLRMVPEAAASTEELERMASDERERRLAHRAARWSADAGRVLDPPEEVAALVSAAGEIGLWGAFDLDDLRQALLARVTRRELERRLPGARIRTFSPYGSQRSPRIDRSEASVALGEASARRRFQLGAELDAVVVTGRLALSAQEAGQWYDDAPHAEHPALALAAGLAPPPGAPIGPDDPAAPPVPVLWSAVDLSATGADAARAWLDGHPQASVIDGPPEMTRLPEPAVLAPRAFDPVVLDRRMAYLRAVGTYPEHGRVVLVHGDRKLARHAADVGAALQRLHERLPDLVFVVPEVSATNGDSEFHTALSAATSVPLLRVPLETGIDDLVALTSAVDGAMSSSATVLLLARAFRRPYAVLDLHGYPSLSTMDRRATSVAEVHEVVAALGDALLSPTGGIGPDHAVIRDQARLDDHFDALAAAMREAVQRRRRDAGSPDPTLGLAVRVAALEVSHAAMSVRANAERVALADSLYSFESEVETVGPELERVRAELEALRNTKVLRTLRPARAVYARLRGGRL